MIIDNEIILNGAIKWCKFDASLDVGIVATSSGTLWYVNLMDSSTVRLVTTHTNRITDVMFINEKYLSTGSEDGTLRIWSLIDREQVQKFEVQTPVSL